MPRHVAIIMDGNGRWAKKRFLPRVAGHRRGVEAVREVVKGCIARGVRVPHALRLLERELAPPARRKSPFLMQLFLKALEQEVEKLHGNGIRFKVIGDLSALRSRHRGAHPPRARRSPPATTASRSPSRPTTAGAGTSCRRPTAAARSDPGAEITEELLSRYLSMNYAPEPDLFIRTGGEERISNFLLWQLAYTELHFTPVALARLRRGRARRGHRLLPRRASGASAARASSWPPPFPSPRSARRRPPGRRMLKTRVLTAIALLPLVLGMLFLASAAAWMAFARAIALVSCWEWSRLCGFGPGARRVFLVASAAHRGGARGRLPARPGARLRQSRAGLLRRGRLFLGLRRARVAGPAPAPGAVGLGARGLVRALADVGGARGAARGEPLDPARVRGARLGGRHRRVFRGPAVRAAQARARDQPGQDLGRRGGGPAGRARLRPRPRRVCARPPRPLRAALRSGRRSARRWRPCWRSPRSRCWATSSSPG